ncbi:unnamed protein product [Orchesella dallaii]|uniref:Uncharacterized protein n=1 Tax=Orchesella dallaii TaxID=48710 RepID=A0ABP1PY58_9HEXA
MLPFRHSHRENENNENRHPAMALQRKADRPSMRSNLPYNGSADYYYNNPPSLGFNPPQALQRRPVFSDNKLGMNNRLAAHPNPLWGQPNAHESIQMMSHPPNAYNKVPQYPQPSWTQNTDCTFYVERSPMIIPTSLPNKFKKGNKHYRNVVMIVVLVILVIFGLYIANGMVGDNLPIKKRLVTDYEMKKPVESNPVNPGSNESCENGACDNIIQNKDMYMKATPEIKKEFLKNEMKVMKATAAKVKVVYSLNDDSESTLEVTAD